MILESIVTTADSAGNVNIAPLGPIVLPPGECETLPRFCLRPYEGSLTCQNLLEGSRGVIHVTDDALLIARTAIGTVDSRELVCPVANATTPLFRLKDCHRWFAFDVIEWGGDPPRHELVARTLAEGVERPFFGFNRAKHAVIELAILATRVQWVPADEIRQQIAWLRPLVEKTAGPDERVAFELIESYLAKQWAAST